ncbi:MAG: ribosome maturation factor RimP [Actinomycetota bacterium]|nr:ribosome maturation factor RimP [Actinomycetota bacterium]
MPDRGQLHTGEEIMAAGEQRWRELAARIVTDAGFDLEDFSVVNAGRRRVVRVIIDADHGVGLDAAAAVSRDLSAAFDADDESTPGASTPYTLEVTSPGIGRPLTVPRHFHRARGRLVAITTTGGESLTARVLGITEAGVDLLGGQSGTDQWQLPFEEIAKARVEVDFSGPSKAVAALLAADPRSADVVTAEPSQDDDSDVDDTDDDTDDAEDENTKDSDTDIRTQEERP